MKRILTYCAVGVLAAATSSANACSVCIAHAIGAALSGLGAQTLPHGKTTVGVSFLHFNKSNGTDNPSVTESESFSQYSIDFNHGLTDRIMLRGSLPFINKSISATGSPTERATGFGDASLGAVFQLPPTPRSKAIVAFSADVKLPSGDNHAKDAGVLKDQPVQLGSGSTDVSVGVDLTREGHKSGELYYAALRARWNGTNNRAYHYGGVIFYGLGYLRPLGKNDGLAVEFNGRIADKDKTEMGTKDPNTGGHLGYLSLSYRRSLGASMGLIVTVQQPVWKQLNGSQEEKTLVSASISRAF